MTHDRTVPVNSHQTNGRSRSGEAPKLRPITGGMPEIGESGPLEYLQTMQQGMVVWSKDGECEFFNQRMVNLNELAENQMFLGYKRTSLLQKNLKRGTADSISIEELEEKFATNEPFVFDRKTKSDRTVVATVQPRNGGGHVVTFADVTDKRLYEIELADAKKQADLAKEQAQTALILETRRKHQSKLLGELGEWLQSCKSLEELYKVIARFMGTLFAGSSGELFVYSNSRDVLESACLWNNSVAHRHIHADDCWALRRGRIFKYGFGMVDFPCTHIDHDTDDEVESDKDRRYICLPIVAHGDTVGLLHIDFASYENPEAPSDPADEDVVSFAIQCSEQISLAIANVRLPRRIARSISQRPADRPL